MWILHECCNIVREKDENSKTTLNYCIKYTKHSFFHTFRLTLTCLKSPAGSGIVNIHDDDTKYQDRKKKCMK